MGIFNYASGNEETKRKFLFSLILYLPQPILAWKDAIIVFFNFLNFFSIFLEFYITRRVRTNWKDIFFFFAISQPFPTYFALKWSHKGIYYFYNFCCYFFGIFNFSLGWNGTKRNDNFYFLLFSSFSNLFWFEKNA